MRTPRHFRLSTWLALLVAGIAAPLLAFAGLQLWAVLDANERERDAALGSRARAIASAVDAEIRSWRAVLTTLAESTDLRAGRFRAFGEEARAAAARYDGWIVVIDAAGQQHVNTLRPAGAPLPKTAAGHMVKAVLRDGKPVTDFTFGAVAQRHIVSNAVPVFRDGQAVLTLAMNFGPERLTRLLEAQKLPATWVTAVIDRQNLVVARSVDAEKRVGRPTTQALRQAVAGAEAGVVSYAMTDGRPAQVAFQRLAEVPWVLTLAVPLAELPSIRPLVGFGWTALLLGLAAMVAAGFVGRTIARPIRRLANLAPTLARSEAPAVDVASRIQEVRQLQEALVEAAERLQATAQERERAAGALKEANERLEQRVAERTEALQQALTESEEGRRLLNTLMENIPEGIAITGGPPDFAFKMISRHGLAMSQRPMASLEGVSSGDHQTRWNICLADGVTRPTPEQMPLHRASRLGEEVRNCEMVLYAQDGRRIDVLVDAVPIRDAEGKIVGATNCWRDITELKRAEEALREAKGDLEVRVRKRTVELEEANRALQAEIGERQRAEVAVTTERQRLYDVLETLPVYVVLLSADYHVPFANRFFRERFGESHGRCCFEYLFGRTTPCENCETYQVLKTQAPHHWEWTGPDGRNYDIYDYPFTDNDGAPLILEMGIDITERKQAEAALTAANETLEQRVAERTAEVRASNEELSRFNRAAVGREIRMIELKKEVNALCGQAGQPPRYALEFDKEQP